jgi:hypothetical protein
MPLVYHLRPPLAAGELAAAAKGIVVKFVVLRGLFVETKGICVNPRKFPRTSV